MLETLVLACRFVDDHFIVDFLHSVMYLNLDSSVGRTYTKISCELNCTSNGFTCLGFTLTKVQIVLLCDIFGTHSH